MAPPRRRDRNTRRADALLGYVIPLFFVALATYQQIKTGAIDKYLIGCLLIFGLGALGWRVDVLIERYLEMRAAIGGGGPPAADPQPDANQGGDDGAA